MIKNSSYKNINLILIVSLFFILIYGYKDFVYPVFAYRGFEYTESALKFFEAFSIFVVTLILINSKRNSKFIYAVNMAILLFLSIPNYILYMFMDITRLIMYSYLLLHIAIIFFSKIPIKLKTYSLKRAQEDKILLFLSFLLLIPFFITYGFNLNFNVLLFQDIYDVRAVSAKSGNVFTGYFYSWLSLVLLPFLIVYGYIKKKKIFILIAIVATLYLFLVAAHKSVFFGLLMLLYLNLFEGYYKKIYALFLAVTIVILLGFFLYAVYDNIIVESMFLRRVFFLPALLNQFYFDFFADNHLYLSHSIFKYFIDYTYAYTPSHVIGLEYFNSVDMGANNGIISDGFMNFGYIGIIINIIIVAFIISFFKAIKLNELLFPIIFLFIFSLNSSALLTVLLTRGLLLFIIMSIFYNKRLNLINKVKK